MTVHDIIQRKFDGWNSVDRDEFSEDIDYLIAAGDHLHGRHEVTVHQDLFNEFVAGTRLGSSITNIPSVTPETVVTHSDGEVLFQVNWKSLSQTQDRQHTRSHSAIDPLDFQTIIISGRAVTPMDRDTQPTATQFDWLTLDDAEELVWTDTPHRLSLVPTFVVGIPLCLVLIGIPIVVSAYLSYTNTNYVVTATALYKKTGIISRDVQRIEFDKVQNTAYQQSAMGSYFGYGTVNISTAGGGGVEMRFRNVAKPRAVQSLINEHHTDRKTHSTDSEDTAAAVLDEILAELQAIRRTVEADGMTVQSDGDEQPSNRPDLNHQTRNNTEDDP